MPPKTFTYRDVQDGRIKTVYDPTFHYDNLGGFIIAKDESGLPRHIDADRVASAPVDPLAYPEPL